MADNIKRASTFLITICMLLTILLIACAMPVAPEAPQPHTNVVHPEAKGDQYDLSYLKDMDPAQVDNKNLPITPVDRLSLTGRPPKDVDIDAYRLTVSGAVQNTLDLTYRELLALPSVTRTVLMICHGSHVDNARWTGIPLSLLMDKAGIQDSAVEATFIALDRYSRSLPITVLRDDGVFIAYKVNDETVPLKHGYPLRLVVTGMYGENWVKWLRHIEVK